MINKAILLGRLGSDPEVRFLPSGGQVTIVSLATSRRWRDKQTNERKEETEWHRVVFFSKLAEIAGEYLKKGSQCYVEGRIRTQKWKNQSGADRYITEIVAEEMHMLDGKQDGQGQRNDAQSATQQLQQAPRQEQANPNPPVNYYDIPF